MINVIFGFISAGLLIVLGVILWRGNFVILFEDYAHSKKLSAIKTSEQPGEAVQVQLDEPTEETVQMQPNEQPGATAQTQLNEQPEETVEARLDEQAGETAQVKPDGLTEGKGMKLDLKSMGKFFGKALWIASGSLVVMVLGELSKYNFVYYIGLTIFVGAIAFAAVYTNTGNRFIIEDTGK